MGRKGQKTMKLKQKRGRKRKIKPLIGFFVSVYTTGDVKREKRWRVYSSK